jgi:hypothetical protein
MQHAVDQKRPPSDLRVLFVLLVLYGAEFVRLFRRVVRELSDRDDTDDDVSGRIREVWRWLEGPDGPDGRERHVPFTEGNVNRGDVFQRRNEGQRRVAMGIIDGVSD